MNRGVYQVAALVLQAAETYNVTHTIGGGRKYNVPSENITFDDPPLYLPSFTYSQSAIAGADDFSDDDTTIEDLFDLIVSVTRKVTPTCEISHYSFMSILLLSNPESSRNRCGYDVCAPGFIFGGPVLTTTTTITSVIFRLNGRFAPSKGSPHTHARSSRPQLSSLEIRHVQSWTPESCSLLT